MFEGFTSETIDFLWGIRFNNERAWFQEHKAAYEKHLYRPMVALAQAVKAQYSLEGTILKPSRIYRDVRYSNGVPYKDHLWFCIREDNVFWSEHPSMYFQIQPEGGSLGFILYSPKAHLMELHRKRMQEKPGEFSEIMRPILADGRFSDQSTRYKRPKEGGTQEMEPWYQLKNCFLEQTIPVGAELFDPALPEKLVDAFHTLETLYHYFRKLEAMES
jgi:uncharacterized protein (TIGR02453 family)